MDRLLLFFRLIRPLFLLGGLLVYALGVGIADYLGQEIDWGIYLLGQAWVTTLQLCTHFLNEYFNAPDDEQNRNRTLFSGGSGAVGEGRLPRTFSAVVCPDLPDDPGLFDCAVHCSVRLAAGGLPDHDTGLSRGVFLLCPTAALGVLVVMES